MSDEIKLPQSGELVVGEVKKVLNYGAFCSLLEYPGVDGFLHVSEVASKWIRNIGDYIKENQKVVLKVTNVEQGKNVVDVSLRRVNENEKKQVMEFFDSNIKSEKLLDAAIKKSKVKAELKEILGSILKSYSSVYDFAFEVYEKGETVAEKVGMPKKLATTYCELVRISLKPSKVTVKAEMSITSFDPDGVEKIKEILSEPEGAVIKYLGAPRYMILLESDSFKLANKKIGSILTNIAKKAKQSNISFEYEIMKNEG